MGRGLGRAQGAGLALAQVSGRGLARPGRRCRQLPGSALPSRPRPPHCTAPRPGRPHCWRALHIYCCLQLQHLPWHPWDAPGHQSREPRGHPSASRMHPRPGPCTSAHCCSPRALHHNLAGAPRCMRWRALQQELGRTADGGGTQRRRQPRKQQLRERTWSCSRGGSCAPPPYIPDPRSQSTKTALCSWHAVCCWHAQGPPHSRDIHAGSLGEGQPELLHNLLGWCTARPHPPSTS